MNSDDKDNRKRRIRNIRKLILILLVILFLLPTFLCIILFIKYNRLNDEIDRLRQLKIERLLIADKRESERVMLACLLGFAREEADKRTSARLAAEQKMRENVKGIVYLTFDDGPSINTDDILNILKENDIKATFFVIGRTDEKSLEKYKRIVSDGHTIGMHSYSHDYGKLYASPESFKKDYFAISDLIYNTTGVRSKFYRFPGGSSNSVSKTDMRLLIDFLKKEGVEYFDWNVMSGDAVKHPPSAKELYRNVIKGVEGMDESTVLMHDLFNKRSMVEALPAIIKKLKAENYLMLPIDDSTKAVHHRITGNTKTVHRKVSKK